MGIKYCFTAGAEQIWIAIKLNLKADWFHLHFSFFFHFSFTLFCLCHLFHSFFQRTTKTFQRRNNQILVSPIHRPLKQQNPKSLIPNGKNEKVLKISSFIPLRAKQVGEFIEIRHKQISPTCILSTLGCLWLCDSVTLKPIHF